MIRYLLFIEIKSAFQRLRNPLNILVNLIFIITAWGYGLLLAELINRANNGELDAITAGNLINYALLAIAGVTLVRMVIPIYTPQKQFFPQYYPLSKLQHYLLSVFSDITKPFFFYLILFIVTCSWHLEYSKFEFLCSGLSVLFSAHLFRRIIQYPIDHRLRNAGFVFVIITLLIFLLLILYPDLFLNHIIYLGLLIPIYLFIVGFLTECQIIENKKVELINISQHGGIYLKLLINNPKARSYLLKGFSFILCALVIDLIMVKTNGKHFFDGKFIYWLFATPLILFTYVFNNLWGFWKNVWLNYELRSGEYKDLLKFSLHIMTIPLVANMIITLPILLLTWDDYQFILLFYFTSLLFLVCTSFVWSLLFPMVVKSTFQLKGISSSVSSIVTMTAVILLSSVKISLWFYILIFSYLIISLIACKLAMDLYKNKKYGLVRKLTTG